ncbi:UNVERIFIED_CONTAM: hypothetical protein GTU68_062714, partial [Idotea baltica]|nr:hypothetical protein [Idotea baltica]
FWKAAGVEHKINVVIGPAAQTLQNLINEGGSGTFDFAFIDADKSNYDTYYENCLTLLRPGGFIAIDNTLWNGRVIEERDQSSDTICIRQLNAKLRDDKRINLSFLMIGDGLSLCFKK